MVEAVFLDASILRTKATTDDTPRVRIWPRAAKMPPQIGPATGQISGITNRSSKTSPMIGIIILQPVKKFHMESHVLWNQDRPDWSLVPPLAAST
jgi:hypothetical protein